MRFIWLALLVPALLAGTGGTLLAARAGDGDAETTIFACARLKDGRLRTVDPAASCKKHERGLYWNVQGPKGDPGTQGADGPTGPQGEPGPGLSSLEELDGLACHPSGQQGAISVSYDAAGRALLSCVGGGGASPAIRINEFSTGISGAGTNEFVELVNAGPAPADLGGFKVVYRSAAGTSDTTIATIPPSTVLAPSAFYLLGGSGYAGSAPADQSFGVALAATGGSLGVRDAGAALLDAVAYGTAANGLGEGSAAPAPPATASPGSSAVRLPDGHDTDDNAADFSITGVPTPKAPNSAG